MTKVKVVAHQKYNNIEMSYPTAMLAGMMMDEMIVSTDGDISFTVTVEKSEEKEEAADAGQITENTDEN